MNERFASNPFSSSSPLRSYGALKKYSDGYEYEGLPYIGAPLPFKDDDSDELRPQLKSNACCAQFDLSNEEDMEQYRAVSQKVCDSLATISFEEKIYDKDIKSWRVLIRWMEHYFAPPKSVERAEKQSAKPPKTIVFPETDTRKPEDVFKKKKEASDDAEDRYATVEEAMLHLGEEMAKQTDKSNT